MQIRKQKQLQMQNCIYYSYTIVLLEKQATNGLSLAIKSKAFDYIDIFWMINALFEDSIHLI